MKKKIVLLLLLSGFIFNLKATNYTVAISGLTYSPNLLTVFIGDVVTLQASAAHPLRQVSKATWDANGTTAVAGGWGTKTANYVYTPGIADTIYYICTAHVGLGMKGKLIVLPAPDFSVLISGNSYTPNLLTVNIGNTILLSASAAHPLVQVSKSVWNANGSTPLSGGWGTKTANYLFTATTSDTIYYVCSFHVGLGMKGRIIVNPIPDFTIQTMGFEYSPDYLEVSPGDIVQIEGSTAHPLVQVSEDTWLNNLANPLAGGWGVQTTDYIFTASSPGTIYYVCQLHVGMGMKGRIVIVSPNSPPQFSSTPPTQASEAYTYTYQITFSDPDAGNSLSLTSVSLPSWLSLQQTSNTSGSLSGIPGQAQVGNHQISLQLSDGIANPVFQNFTISVEANQASVFSSSPVISASVGSAYNYSIAVSDADPEDVLNLSCPVKPAWLSFNLTEGGGTLTGTPTDANIGSHPVQLSLSDGIGSPVTQSFTVTVPIPTLTQTINLPASWSIFSTNVIPSNPAVNMVLLPIVSAIRLVKSGSGSIYWPQFNVNTIGQMVSGQGYQINCVSAQSLNVTGLKVIPQTQPVNIPQGWSMIAYLRQSPGAINQMLQTIQPSILLVKSGSGGIYWPQFSVNSIINMQPGQGYQINLNSPQTLTYPAN